MVNGCVEFSLQSPWRVRERRDAKGRLFWSVWKERVPGVCEVKLFPLSDSAFGDMGPLFEAKSTFRESCLF